QQEYRQRGQLPGRPARGGRGTGNGLGGARDRAGRRRRDWFALDGHTTFRPPSGPSDLAVRTDPEKMENRGRIVSHVLATGPDFFVRSNGKIDLVLGQ